jgi:polysaccharide biosynthesis transport protein
MSPNHVLGILWRRAWIVALTFLSALGAASAVLIFVPGRYDAIATARIDPGTAEPLSGATGAATSTLINITQGNLIAIVQSNRVAIDVVRQLNLVADPAMQEGFRQSDAFGRLPIESWIAATLLKSVDPKFELNSNILDVKYKSNSAERSALVANAFLAATIEEAIAMKAASAEQTARWFGPQIEAMKRDLATARENLQEIQQKTSLLPLLASGDSENSQLMAVTQDLSAAKAALTGLQSRYYSGSVDLSSDPSDPDLQVLSILKAKFSQAEADYEQQKSQVGANNPKAVTSLATKQSLQSQIDEAMRKMHQNLGDRIESTKAQVKRLEEAREKALGSMIQVQGQRDKLTELQRDVVFKQDLLESEEKEAAQAGLQSKLTFTDIAVLDKATPPADPAFPKPLLVLGVAIGAGLSLGLILALLAEALDRRVRYPQDLAFATSAPVLGVVVRRRTSGPGRKLSPAKLALATGGGDG